LSSTLIRIDIKTSPRDVVLHPGLLMGSDKTSSLVELAFFNTGLERISVDFGLERISVDSGLERISVDS
jgi:hypothetical protein